MTTQKILVIEDNEKNMKLVRLLLEIGNYQVLESEDAETGVEIAQREVPDLILMDIQLPGMDGLQATQEIKKDPKLSKIPVVALTSYAMDGDKARVLNAGCDGYFAKPIDTKNFLNVLRSYLNPKPAEEPSTLPAPKSNTVRILIVDDDEKNVKLMCGMLTRDDYELSTAGDGPTALSMIEENTPDLILLDVMMPGMDGYEVTRRLKAKAETNTIPIILITALDSPADRAQGLEAGAEEFLTKPVNPVEIEARIQSMLKLKRYRDQLTIRSQSENQVGSDDPVTETVEDTGHPRRILMVEDDEKDLKVFKRQLDTPEYQLETVKSGADALDVVRSRPFDLILLDVLLPGVNGFEICRRIKEMDHAKDTQVVLITCLTDLENKIKGVESGADDYLVKPIDPRELQARVKALLKKKTYLDSLHAHYEKALNSSLLDGMTGLYNHSYFKRFLDLEIKRSQRQGHSTALLMLDLDDFKQINDSLGHVAGDDILREVAGLLKKSIREIDVAARYGGEEFAIVLPYGDNYGSGVVGDRLRSLIEDQSFTVTGSDQKVRVTLSIGGAVYPDDADTAIQLIKTADSLLYEAKRMGKNRVVISNREASSEPLSMAENY